MLKLRLDRILSAYTPYTRREGSELIRKGLVSVEDTVCRDPAAKFSVEGLRLQIAGKSFLLHEQSTFMLNKPAGYISTTEESGGQSVLDLISEEDRFPALFPAGRLDKDTTGLLLLTSDGALCHRIISPSHEIYKTYSVTAEGILTEDDVRRFSEGIYLENEGLCRPAFLEILRSDSISEARVRICEGKYHQVKRMFAACGKTVMALRRDTIGGLSLDASLLPGHYRRLTNEEISGIFSDPV